MGDKGKRKNEGDAGFPEPTLWNSEFGRRIFLKRTGIASAATVFALHGFKTEILASESACNYKFFITKYRVYLTNNSGTIQYISGVGSSNESPGNAHMDAALNLVNNAIGSPYLNPSAPNGGNSPQTTWMCERAELDKMDVKILPEDAGAQPVTVTGSDSNGYHEVIEFPVYSQGQTVIVVDITYKNKEC